MALVSKREVHISTDVDLATTNRLLERIANSLEVYLSDVCGVDITAQSATDNMQSTELERFDSLGPAQQEFAAMIEIMEEQGVRIPAAAYKLIGLDPPHNDGQEPVDGEDEGEEEEGPDAEQAVEEEPVTARREE